MRSRITALCLALLIIFLVAASVKEPPKAPPDEPPDEPEPVSDTAVTSSDAVSNADEDGTYYDNPVVRYDDGLLFSGIEAEESYRRYAAGGRLSATARHSGTPLSSDEIRFRRGNQTTVAELEELFGPYVYATAEYEPLSEYYSGGDITWLILDWGGLWDDDLTLTDIVIEIIYPGKLDFIEKNPGYEWWDTEGTGFTHVPLSKKDKKTVCEVKGMLWNRSALPNSRGITIGMSAAEVCTSYADSVYLTGGFGYGDSYDLFTISNLFFTATLSAHDFDSVLRTFSTGMGVIGYDVIHGEVQPPEIGGEDEYGDFVY